MTALAITAGLLALYLLVWAWQWWRLRRETNKRRLKLPRDKAPLRAVDGR